MLPLRASKGNMPQKGERLMPAPFPPRKIRKARCGYRCPCLSGISGELWVNNDHSQLQQLFVKIWNFSFAADGQCGTPSSKLDCKPSSIISNSCEHHSTLVRGDVVGAVNQLGSLGGPILYIFFMHEPMLAFSHCADCAEQAQDVHNMH